jgi:class 3 adenylate cyclase
LVDSRFRAKVTDFGLSQDKGSAGCAGTPFWMAPELLSGQSGNTMASDVYSFGIILYEIFSRRDPYDGEDPATVLHLVADELVQKRPPTPKTMPAQIQSIMKDSVQHEADNRPTFQEVDMRLQRMDAEDLRLASSQFSQSFGRATSISLFDIFPRHVAKALREGREVEAEHRDMVTIFFSDIVGFTQLSSELPARKVAVLLDRLYTKLDALSRKHDVFKVETIGDAYMAVTNLVKDQEKDHAKRIAEFAIDAIKEANETLIDEDDPEKGCVNIRVGFHSGSVVADVVGTRNLRYCLFGDSVNTASRMESNSKSNRIHCSCASAEILAAQSPSMPLKSRGLIPIKGKGEMHTFWINEGHKSGTFSREDFEATMIDWAKEQHKDSNERRGSRRRQNAANFLLRPLEMLNRPIEMLNRSSGTFDKSPKLSRQGKDLRAEIGNMSIHEDSLFMSELELRLDTAPPQESFVEK